MKKQEFGAMRTVVTIEVPVETVDASGAPGYSSWATFATAYASVKPVSANEYMLAQQVAATLTHVVRCRFVSGVTSKMRIKYRPENIDRYLYIVTPPQDEDERHFWLVLRCQEREEI